MKIFLQRMLARIIYYALIYFWFWFAVPALWNQRSSAAMEILFGFSFFFAFSTFYFEKVMFELSTNNKEENDSKS